MYIKLCWQLISCGFVKLNRLFFILFQNNYSSELNNLFSKMDERRRVSVKPISMLPIVKSPSEIVLEWLAGDPGFNFRHWSVSEYNMVSKIAPIWFDGRLPYNNNNRFVCYYQVAITEPIWLTFVTEVECTLD